MTKKFHNQKVNDAELNLVSGGTVEELWDLARRIVAKNPGFLGKFGAVAGKIADLLQNKTGVGKVTSPLNYILADAVADHMKSRGVKCDISIGVAGTGLWESSNRYEYNGQRIPHDKAVWLV